MASRLQDVHLRGLAASRPLATVVASGTLYFATDTGVTTRASDTASGIGGAWETYSGGGGGSSSTSIGLSVPFNPELEESEYPYIIPGERGPTGATGPAGGGSGTPTFSFFMG